jgi:hypothetical protein
LLDTADALGRAAGCCSAIRGIAPSDWPCEKTRRIAEKSLGGSFAIK